MVYPPPHCKVAVMLREGDTSPTDIPKCLGGRQDLEAGRSRGSKMIPSGNLPMENSYTIIRVNHNLPVFLIIAIR